MLTFVGDDNSPHHPEIIFTATANAAMHFNDNYRIWTETIDARVGCAFEYEFDPALRASIGISHNSGHAADGIADLDLYEPTLGEEFVPLKAVYDWGTRLRVGATFKPFILAFPTEVQFFSADAFVDYFPWGQDNPHQPAPYVSFGIDEMGVGHPFYTFHGQLGVLLGNHFGRGHHQTIRGVVGYYNGADPRMKYFQYRQATMDFAYIGIMGDI